RPAAVGSGLERAPGASLYWPLGHALAGLLAPILDRGWRVPLRRARVLRQRRRVPGARHVRLRLALARPRCDWVLPALRRSHRGRGGDQVRLPVRGACGLGTVSARLSCRDYAEARRRGPGRDRGGYSRAALAPDLGARTDYSDARLRVPADRA